MEDPEPTLKTSEEKLASSSILPEVTTESLSEPTPNPIPKESKAEPLIEKVEPEREEKTPSGSSDLDIEALLKQVQSEEAKGAEIEPPKKEDVVPPASGSVSDDDIANLLKEAGAVASPVEAAPILESHPVEKKGEEIVGSVLHPPEETSSAPTQSEGVAKEVDPPLKKVILFPAEKPSDVLEKEVSAFAKTVPLLGLTKEFDLTTDPDVVEMRGRMKEKVQELLKNFVSYKTFSLAFVRQIPKVLSRRRKAKQIIRDFTDWIEREKAKIQQMEDPVKKGVLEKASIVFDQEMLVLRRKGGVWVRQGWRKSALLIVWLISLGVALAIGIPSLLRIYYSKQLHIVEVKEMEGVEKLPVDEHHEGLGPTSYLLLSCEASQMGKLGKIMVYNREGSEVARYPATLNPLKKKLLIQVPSGELGIIIETDEYPIVGVLEMLPNQRRFIDLSKWTDPEARALVKIESTPEGIPIVCNGTWVGKGFAKIYLIAGVHKIWAALPNFPAQEQQIMVVDDRELTIGVTVNMGRFVFRVPDAVKKTNPLIKIWVNGSVVTNWDSHPILSGYHMIKITDAERTVLQQELNMIAADEAVFNIQRLENGEVSAALVSKTNLLGSH